MTPRHAHTLLLVLLSTLLVAGGCKKKPKPKPSKAQLGRIETAQKLLADAGFPEGKGFPKVTILFNRLEAHKTIAEAIQQMWKKNLGIEVDLIQSEWKVYLEQRRNKDFDIARAAWIGDYLDPNTFLELMTSWSENNNTGWKNKAFDDLIVAAEKEADAAKRLRLLEKAEALLLEDMPVAPIYFYVTKRMYRTDQVKGLYENLQGLLPLREVVKGDGKGTLAMQLIDELQTLDPATARGVSEHRVQMCLFEGLMNYDPKTSRATPGVAERFVVSPDKKTYTFHLRDCVWSDGKPVRAQDFVYAWKRVLDPKTGADYAHFLYPIQGAREFNQGKGPASAIQVRAKDDKTLLVRLHHPVPYFLDITPFFVLYPARQDVIEKYGKDWTDPEHFVGNGPFRLVKRVINQYVLLEKNGKYWAAEKVKQKNVKWVPVNDQTTAWRMYEEGQLDYLDTVALELLEKAKKRSDYQSGPYLGVYYYSFNITRKPFTDKRVRRALALAIDREQICEKVTKAGEKAAYHFVPPYLTWMKYTSPTFGLEKR